MLVAALQQPEPPGTGRPSVTPASPKPHGAVGHGLWDPRQGTGGVSDRENGVHPSLPKIQGCSACPRLPYARRQTHKPLAHAFLHTLIPPLGQSPPTAALAATPPRGMPGHSCGQPGLPSSPKTPLQGCWGELVSDHKHPPPALPIFSLEKALEGIFFFLVFFFFLNQKKPPQKLLFFSSFPLTSMEAPALVITH